jgi:hypothetical protein
VSGDFQTIDPPPPLHPASVSSPRTNGGRVHTRWAVREWGANILEDARHWIGHLQYNPSPSVSNNICRLWKRVHVEQDIIKHFPQHVYYIIMSILRKIMFWFNS